jgi:hypothetical protein
LRQVVFADSSVAGLLITAAFFMPIAWQSDSLQARRALTCSCPHRTLISPVSLLMATLHFPMKSFMSRLSPPRLWQRSPHPHPHATSCSFVAGTSARLQGSFRCDIQIFGR